MNKISKNYYNDSTTPCMGIKTVIMIWVTCCLITNLIIYYNHMTLLKFVLNIGTLFIYPMTIKKIEMSLKERYFLREFSVYPILISIIGLFSSNNYYSVYNSIPLSLIIVLAALNYIYRYFRDKKFICLILINVVFIILVLVSNLFKVPFMNNIIALFLLFIASLMMKEEL